MALGRGPTSEGRQITLPRAGRDPLDSPDIEEKQNDRLLRGNTEILHGVATLEQRILALEQAILATVQHDDTARPGGE